MPRKSKKTAEDLSETPKRRRRRRPASTPEARENQMIALAERLAEQQLEDGTASAQVIVHYLKLATSKNQLEMQKLRSENQLLEAKADAIQSEQHADELYKNALDAMRAYSGYSTDEEPGND